MMMPITEWADVDALLTSFTPYYLTAGVGLFIAAVQSSGKPARVHPWEWAALLAPFVVWGIVFTLPAVGAGRTPLDNVGEAIYVGLATSASGVARAVDRPAVHARRRRPRGVRVRGLRRRDTHRRLRAVVSQGHAVALLTRQMLPLMLALATVARAQPPRRAVTVEDVYRERDVSDPQISPDGQWVAYTVSMLDSAKDESVSDVWMTSWDGQRSIQLTHGTASQHAPRFSPDGKSLAFLSSREDPHGAAQVWILDRAGGEAGRVTNFPGGVDDYAWSPDGTRLAIVATDSTGDTPVPQPIVLDRYQFKADITGYLTGARDRLYVFDIANRRATLLDSANADVTTPAFAPDGRAIAYVRKSPTAASHDPDRADNNDVYLVDLDAQAAPRRVTTWEGDDNDPDWASPISWSPDSKSIAYTRGGDPKLIYYTMQHLYVAPATGGAPRAMTPAFDNIVTVPRWSPDGRWLYFLDEEDRAVGLARVPAGGGPIEHIVHGRQKLEGYAMGPAGHIAMLQTTLDRPDEIFAIDPGKAPRQITHQNDAWLDQIIVAPTQEISAKSAEWDDDQRVHGHARWRARAR